MPTLNLVGFREFDLIVIVKDTNSYYVLKSLLPQTFDSKTININGIEYQHTRLKQTTNSNVNEKYSTRSWMDEITLTTTGGGVSGGGKLIGLPMEREELGGYGSDWTYDPSFDPGGGGNSSNEIIIPATPEDNPFKPKPYEICNKSINVKTIGNSYNAYITGLGITLVNYNGKIVNIKIPNLYITVPNYNISSNKFEENIKGAWSIAIQKATRGIGNNPNPTIIKDNVQKYMIEWLAKSSIVDKSSISVSTSNNISVPETKINYCL
ncbi:hypothetical protein [Myroides sp. C4067]|uniref:hypothetical protein n=1 Tax=Myroides sp. C4067 TaxID=3136765 RepID=UPI003101021B